MGLETSPVVGCGGRARCAGDGRTGTLPPYQPHDPAVPTTPTGVAEPGFDAATSRRDASEATARSDVYDNADGSTTVRTYSHDDRRVRSGAQPAPDDLVHGLLAQISAAPTPQPVRTWVEVLSDTAVRQVTTRLTHAGHVRREVTRRRLVGHDERWVPTDMNTAAWPTARLATALRARRRLDVTDQGLAALAWACGLDRHLLDGAPPHAYDDLRRLVDHGWPPIADLARQTRAALGRTVAAHRG